MNSHQPEKIQAYLDGELSKEEASQFESQLSELESSHLKKESDFNQLLNEKINASEIKCPDELWASIKANLNTTPVKSDIPKIQEISNFKSLLPTLLKFAAILLVGFFIGNFGIDDPKNKTTQTASVEPEIKGSLEEIQQILSARGFDIQFKQPSPTSYHTISFKGMDWVQAKNQTTAVRMLFSCCDYPVIVYIKKAKKSPSTAIDLEREHRKLIHHLKKGDDRYLIDAYSNHHPGEVLDLIY